MMGGAHHNHLPSLFGMMAELTAQVGKLIKALQSSSLCACSSSAPKTPGTTARTAAPTTGTVKWYNVKDRYGFIRPSDGGPDIFVHETDIMANNPHHWCPSLAVGEPVWFMYREGRRGPWAANVTGPDGQAVQGSHYARFSDIHVKSLGLRVELDSVSLPPAPEFDRPLTPPPNIDAEVANILTEQPAPLSFPLAPPYKPHPSSEDFVQTVFSDCMTGEPPRGAFVHQSGHNHLVLAHPETCQSVVLEVVERVKKGTEERAMRTHFWDLALGEGDVSKPDSGCDIYEQDVFRDHQFPECGEETQRLTGIIEVESVRIGRQVAVTRSEAKVEVIICMVLIRLPGCPGDVLMTFNNPYEPKDYPLTIPSWHDGDFWDFARSCRFLETAKKNPKLVRKAVCYAVYGYCLER